MYVLSRLVAIIYGVACLCALDATRVSAQCGAGYGSLDFVQTQRSVALVFLGIVRNVERVGPAEIVTFDTERAWKGPVTRQLTIYRPVPVPPPLPPPATGRGIAPAEFNPTIFRPGSRYVVIAHRLSTAERNDLGLSDQAVFGTNICGDGSRPLAVAVTDGPDLAKLGSGRGPIDQQPPVRGPFVALPIKIADADPVYPDAARAAGIHGVVIVSFTVDPSGSVGDIKILRSLPFLDQAAIECALKWKYLPALMNGVPAPMQLTATVEFE